MNNHNLFSYFHNLFSEKIEYGYLNSIPGLSVKNLSQFT